IPLVVGTAGGSGAKPHLERFLETLREVAARNRLHFRLAVIPADVPAATVLQALRERRLAPCGQSQPLTEEDVRACTHIVAQMGTEPIIRALDGGAQVVIAGRCCDAAIFAAEPIRHGFDPGLALHVGKIMECGTLCASPAGANDVLMGTIGATCFEVVPASPQRRCTPESVAAHSLYEQPDPNCFYEPEGRVELSGCTFEPVGQRGVRVRGSCLVRPAQETVKLEGARCTGYRSITIAGIRDPGIIERLDDLERSVRETVKRTLADTLRPDEMSLRLLRYGLDGVTGPLEGPPSPLPREVGLVIDAIAPSQAMADRVLKLARATALHQHYNGRKTTAGNLAFPFSPSDFSGGPVYEFSVYHLMQVPDLSAVFPVQFEEV
ncbi:MAG: acyclic terpene utilization AtuA family protein, partial [Armatimonadetes bacterium]|nr:acyclic terpene utilization AtuA family protein [Armatimonadota bacterium]